MKKYYYTIGEVSNLIDVKPHVIRYWESEFSALRPKKGEGRIRKYSEDHILLLKKIKDMLYNQRFTIEGARQKLKQERTALANIAAETVANDSHKASPKHAVSLSQDRETEYTNLLHTLRDELSKLLTQCQSHHKEHK